MKSVILLSLALGMCSPDRVVSVPCIDPADLPAETPRPVLTGNAGIDLARMTDTALQLLDEATKLRAAMAGCVG